MADWLHLIISEESNLVIKHVSALCDTRDKLSRVSQSAETWLAGHTYNEWVMFSQLGCLFTALV